jgi:hypothetical protein
VGMPDGRTGCLAATVAWAAWQLRSI